MARLVLQIDTDSGVICLQAEKRRDDAANVKQYGARMKNSLLWFYGILFGAGAVFQAKSLVAGTLAGYAFTKAFWLLFGMIVVFIYISSRCFRRIYLERAGA